MKYLFKNRFNCTDVDVNIHNEMVKRGYDCIRIIDEDDSNYETIYDNLKNQNVVLVTSDHLDGEMWHVTNKPSYSINYTVDYLKPQRKFFGMHDLGIHCVGDKVDEWNILLPHETWREMFSGFNCKVNTIGYPKFYNKVVDIKYDVVFFVSSVYIYLERDVGCFYTDFKPLFDLKIPFKFPKFPGIEKLTNFVESFGIEVIDPDLESFNLLFNCNTAIVNASSSLAIEASIAGCNSINIGSIYQPTHIYDKFEVLCVDINQINNFIFNKRRKMVKYEYMLDIDKAINLIIKDDIS